MANKPSGAAPTAPSSKSRPPEKGLLEKLFPSVYALWRVIKKPRSQPSQPAGTTQFPGQPPEPPTQESAEPVAETPVAPETKTEPVQPAVPQLQPMGQSEPAQPQQPPEQPILRTPPVEDQPQSTRPEFRLAPEREQLLAEPEFDAEVEEPDEEPEDQDINLGWSEIEDSTNKAREELLALQKTRAESSQVSLSQKWCRG